MATRSQIERLTRQVDKLALTMNEASTAFVPIYANETEAEALEAYGQPTPGKVVFNRARPGDRREDCECNGMDSFYRLVPSDVRRLLAKIDGNTRGMPTNPSIESFRGSQR